MARRGAPWLGIVALLMLLWDPTAQACPHLNRQQRTRRKRSRRCQDGAAQMIESAHVGATVLPPNHPRPFYVEPSNVREAVDVAREQIWHLIATNEADNLAAKFLRLTFHDCVGGICDGCVDLSNPDNFGLRAPVQALAPVVFHNREFLTTGDVWVLAGLVACRSSQSGTSFDFDMEYVGRPECDSRVVTRGPNRGMPSAHDTTNEVLTFFADTFDFSPQETVAILGAHTMGKAMSINSGFGGDGGWDPSPNILNNDYFHELLDYQQFELDFEDNANFPPFPNQFYWEESVPEGAPPGTFMLHADMALAFDFDGYVDPISGMVNCTMTPNASQDTCPPSTLLPQAQAYASDNDQWLSDFRDAYLKMVSTGCRDGRDCHEF